MTPTTPLEDLEAALRLQRNILLSQAFRKSLQWSVSWNVDLRPYLRTVQDIIHFHLTPFLEKVPPRFSSIDATSRPSISQHEAQAAMHVCRDAELYLDEKINDPAFTDAETFGNYTENYWWQEALAQAEPIIEGTRKEIAKVKAFYASRNTGDEGSIKTSTTPNLTQTQHADAWDVGLPGNVFKKGRPAKTLWDRFKSEDKKAALPLDEVQALLRDYWSRKDPKRIPQNIAEVWALYVKKGFAAEIPDMSG